MQTEQSAEPRVTTRAMLDPTRLCSVRCVGCYYRPTDDFDSVKTWVEQAAEVLKALHYGCDCADLTGGEPLQNPEVAKLVKFATESGLPVRIITSLICTEKTLDGVLDAGVDDWLISFWGCSAETHNALVNVPRARHFQVRRLAKIAARMRYCANYIIVHQNQTEIADWARWMLSLDHQPPKIVNFINFNVFPEWEQNGEEIRQAGVDNVADISIAGPLLDEAIDILEDAGVGVNCRYLPMCALSERHWKNVVNDRQVWCDNGEWRNGFYGMTSADEVYRNYAIPLSHNNEHKGEPCNRCDLRDCCGGANKMWLKFACEKFGSSPLVPITLPDGPKDFWHYRGTNVMGLDPRRATE